METKTFKSKLLGLSFQTWLIIGLVLLVLFLIGKNVFKPTDNTYSDYLKTEINNLQKQRDSISKVSIYHIKKADSVLAINDSIRLANDKLSREINLQLGEIDKKQKRIDAVLRERNALLEKIKKVEVKPVLKDKDDLLKAFEKYK